MVTGLKIQSQGLRAGAEPEAVCFLYLLLQEAGAWEGGGHSLPSRPLRPAAPIAPRWRLGTTALGSGCLPLTLLPNEEEAVFVSLCPHITGSRAKEEA